MKVAQWNFPLNVICSWRAARERYVCTYSRYGGEVRYLDSGVRGLYALDTDC